MLSLLGNGIATVALPLIVLQATGSPLGMSVLAISTAVPSVVVGLLSGALIDRINRRTASAASDTISAISIAALPLVDMLWGLDLVWFILLGILGSFGDVPGMTAREVLAPMVARHTGLDLRRVVGLRQTFTSVALIVGPATAGLLLAVIDSMSVLWITAATSALAAILTRMLPHRLGAADPSNVSHRPLLRELVDGLVAVGRNRFLLATTVLILGLAVALGGLQGLVMPVYFEMIGRPDLLGLVLTAVAAGMLVGATVYSCLVSRQSSKTWLRIGFMLTTVGFALMASLHSPLLVFAGAIALGVGNAITGALIGVLQIRQTPGGILGRVLSVKTALLTVAAPAGIGLAGLLAEVGSPLLAGSGLIVIWGLVLFVVIASRALRDIDPKETADA